MRLQEEWLAKGNTTLKFMTKKEFMNDINTSALPPRTSTWKSDQCVTWTWLQEREMNMMCAAFPCFNVCW